MASISVSAPQGFPVGTTLSVYVDRVGDVIPQGTPVSTAVIAADSSVVLTGLSYGIPYQAGVRWFWDALSRRLPAGLLPDRARVERGRCRGIAGGTLTGLTAA